MTEPIPRIPGANRLGLAAASYALFALFVMVEALDFLAFLDEPDEGFHATYDMTAVGFFFVEMTVCGFFAVAFALLRLGLARGWSAVAACLTLTAIRVGLIWFLYLDYHIHKIANPFSEPMRAVFPLAQIVLGLVAAWAVRPRPSRSADADAAAPARSPTPPPTSVS